MRSCRFQWLSRPIAAFYLSSFPLRKLFNWKRISSMVFSSLTTPSNAEPSPAPNYQLLVTLDNCKDRREFQQIHSLMITTGLVRCAIKQRQLISFCCRRDVGNMVCARNLFDKMDEPDIFIWNTMIRGYSSQGFTNAAVWMYMEMLGRGCSPDSYTFHFLVKSFTGKTALKCGEEVHAQILKFGLSSDNFVRNTLIHMYSLSGRMDDARQLFNKSSKQDAMTWNAMIAGYNRKRQFEESCNLFWQMEKENVNITSVTLVSVLSACTRLKDSNRGRRVHQYIKNLVILPNLILENALIDLYAKCGDMASAFCIFENMKVRDVISWTAMVTGFANSGQIHRARLLFNQMPERDLISWTAMIDAYVLANRFREALELFRKMQAADIGPDEFTMVSVLTACAHLGALEVGEWIRVYIDRNGINLDIFVGNALIDMYTKCGNVVSAAEIFQKMLQRDKFTWTAMILGLAVNGYGEEALDLFSKMLGASILPDEITYIGVLSACTHAGLVEKGRELFSSMTTNHGILPNVVHYGCMVDLLGRAGHLEEALEVISNMPMKPNSEVWRTLLAACRVHKNAHMAEMSAMHLLDLDPQNGATHLLLSDIYARSNSWEELYKVRKIMTERGIRKRPGCSLIEMNGTVHEFVAGDRSHPNSNELYSKLEEIGKELRHAGYAPDTMYFFFGI